jgi:hypothetical protein
MAEMGFDSAWCGVVHRDTDHEHLHLMACRIDFNGKTITDANDYRRAEAAIRRIEADYGLIAVPDPPRKAAKTIPTTTTKEENTMNDTTNPFPPGSPHHAVWPNGFDPGCDLAELALIETMEGVIATSASVGEELSNRKERDLRRPIFEKGYEHELRGLFCGELATVYKHAGVAVLYFRPGNGRLADAGHKVTVLGEMPEHLAASRIVGIARTRGWPSITFTGSANFIELAMREAMACGMPIVANGEEQEAILAKLRAEKAGGMGAMAGPIEADPILAPLAELDNLPAQTLPRTAPTTRPEESPAEPSAPPATPAEPPRQPVLGVAPMFPSLRERLKERRERLGLTQPSGPMPINPIRPRTP